MFSCPRVGDDSGRDEMYFSGKREGRRGVLPMRGLDIKRRGREMWIFVVLIVAVAFVAIAWAPNDK